jgi:D-glycero-D-manno-heptose 1,7-bisphosphate phosphatase
VYLDRDGVLNRNRADHVKDWTEFRFLPGALRALNLLARLDLPIIVVTNQAIINRGIVPAIVVDDLHARMIEQVRRAHGRIDHVYYCPHRSDELCGCRKPAPGLLLKSAAELEVDLSRSVFVGDAISDIVAGRRAGCGTVLVRSGRGRRACHHIGDDPLTRPDAIADDLFRAVPRVIEVLGSRSLVPPAVTLAPEYMGLLSAGSAGR